ncbi:hypothetical protein PR048_002844 [Dryococelus australis]|uniref:Uncharacterized protein n=1 Tax=Dryococelus australis TaxID=614101 RepID=A0ABQ9ILD6_9NEOP|nr:hypothetical protein PR048_002844 [Dryococelus australis]
MRKETGNGAAWNPVEPMIAREVVNHLSKKTIAHLYEFLPEFANSYSCVLLNTNDVLRADEVSMEQCRNERVGETGDTRENPPTNEGLRHAICSSCLDLLLANSFLEYWLADSIDQRLLHGARGNNHQPAKTFHKIPVSKGKQQPEGHMRCITVLSLCPQYELKHDSSTSEFMDVLHSPKPCLCTSYSPHPQPSGIWLKTNPRLISEQNMGPFFSCPLVMTPCPLQAVLSMLFFATGASHESPSTADEAQADLPSRRHSFQDNCVTKRLYYAWQHLEWDMSVDPAFSFSTSIRHSEKNEFELTFTRTHPPLTELDLNLRPTALAKKAKLPREDSQDACAHAADVRTAPGTSSFLHEKLRSGQGSLTRLALLSSGELLHFSSATSPPPPQEQPIYSPVLLPWFPHEIGTFVTNSPGGGQTSRFPDPRKAIGNNQQNEPMRVTEMSMEQCRNEGAGETGEPREDPPTSGIVRHDSHLRKGDGALGTHVTVARNTPSLHGSGRSASGTLKPILHDTCSRTWFLYKLLQALMHDPPRGAPYALKLRFNRPGTKPVMVLATKIGRIQLPNWYEIWPHKTGNAMTGATLTRMTAAMMDLAQAFMGSGIVCAVHTPLWANLERQFRRQRYQKERGYDITSEKGLGWAVSLLASHQCEPGSIPGRVTPGFSRVGIVPDGAAGGQIISGISHFPHPFIPALLHTHLNHPLRISRPRPWVGESFDKGMNNLQEFEREWIVAKYPLRRIVSHPKLTVQSNCATVLRAVRK